jgi:hypothetical protein
MIFMRKFHMRIVMLKMFSLSFIVLAVFVLFAEGRMRFILILVVLVALDIATWKIQRNAYVSAIKVVKSAVQQTSEELLIVPEE